MWCAEDSVMLKENLIQQRVVWIRSNHGQRSLLGGRAWGAHTLPHDAATPVDDGHGEPLDVPGEGA